MEKKLRKNLIFNTTYQILILFLPLITTAYLSRILGPEGIGIFSYTFSIATYFTYITMLGLSKYGNRMIASVQADKEKVSNSFIEIYKMQEFCFICCVILYTIYVLFFAEYKIAALIQGIYVMSSLFDINWFFFGMEMFDKIVIRNIIVKLSAVICVFIFVKEPGDLYIYILIMVISYLMSQLALWPYLKRYIVYRPVSYMAVKRHIKPNLMMFLPVIAVSIYKIMDKIMLGAIVNASEVGYYESAEKIINVPISVITAFGTVMLPRITALIAEKNEKTIVRYRDTIMLFIIAFSVASAFGIAAVSKEVTLWLYGEKFTNSAAIMSLLAVTIIFLGAGNVIRTQLLIPYRFDKIYVQSAFVGAVINVIVNTALIPVFRASGAAIGTICAEFFVCAYQCWMIRKQIPLSSYIRQTTVLCFAGLVMSVVIRLLPSINLIAFDLLFKIVAGGVSYCLLVVPYILWTAHRQRGGEIK